MFEATNRYYREYEQGLYGCLVVKPSRRMRASLGVDREVLAVASTFADQQQRTIRFIEQEIEISEGRYDTTIAIIMHRDPDGDAKLKNWGRQKGISILPISLEKLERCNDDVNAISLEKVLCVELYSHDLFDVTGPVSDDHNFFGRREEAIDLARKLQTGQIRACFGIRKVGKTSIINRVVREIERSHDCITVMMDCSRDAVWSMTAPQLLAAMSHAVDNCSDGYHAVVSAVATEVDLNQACTKLEKRLLGCERPLVFILDEVDYISPGSPTDERWRTDFNVFWRNLRSVLQECSRQGRPVSILVSGVSSHWFSVESIAGVENAAVAFVPEEYLSPMAERATFAMLRRLGMIAGLRFDERALGIVAHSTGNMPYWARKCCSYIHRQIPVNERPCDVTAERVNPLVEQFVSNEGVAIAEVALKHLFRVHPQLREAAMECHNGNESRVSERLKSALRRYGILLKNGGIQGVMMKKAMAGLRTDQGSDQLMEEGAGGESGPSWANGGLREWAEELATLGSRRNVLERRLRAIVVNFVRFDYLGRTAADKKTIRERLLMGVQEAKRKQLRHLPAEDILSKFTWKELTELVHGREWGLFEKIFGDQKKFSEMSDLINDRFDRFDAHAKDAALNLPA